jgi:hypothetical protein
LARFSDVCPLGGHIPYTRKWSFMARMACGRCCMCGPNYVKLSRVFAAKLFSMSIAHYAPALPPPGPIRPPLAPHTAMTSPPPFASPSPIHCNTHCPRQRPGSGNHDMSRLSTSRYPTKQQCAHPRPCLPTYAWPTPANEHWVWHPRPSLPDHTRQHPLPAIQTSAVATTTCLDYLRLDTQAMRPPIHGLADIRLPCSQRILGVAPPARAPRPDTHDTTTLATQTPPLPANYLHVTPFDARRSTRIHLAVAPFRAS